MRVTWDGGIEPGLDLDLAATATCADIITFLAQRGIVVDALWCGAVRLDADHSAGTAPLTHGALLSRQPGAPSVSLSDPHLAVISGPDAGHMIPLTREGVSVGRGDECDVTIQDPSVSEVHARVGFEGSAWARDGGSLNGTLLVRADGTRRRGKKLRLAPGDQLVLGGSVAQLRPLPGASEKDRPRASLGSAQWGAVGAGAMSGILMAVITGRWYFALLAFAYPLLVAAPWVWQRLKRTNAQFFPALAATRPCPTVTDADSDGNEPPRGLVAFVGPRSSALATARALVLTRRARPPVGSWSEPWMRWLPQAQGADDVLIVAEDKGPPSWAGTVVQVREEATEATTATSFSNGPLCLVSAATADSLARIVARTRSTRSLPSDVAWADLAATPTLPRHGRLLSTAIGVSERGVEYLDLDADGPHFLVAGTTGAGKSALLETLVLGLASQYSPEDLAVALIDFKGGAGLRHCMGLPHVVGSLTDLDRHLADRALLALSAELVSRKRAVAEAGHSSFAQWERDGGAPPRLLVVADEYQEIAQHHREFMPHLARLAAQGRSLGLHLILATQRPAGAVTPEIRANVTTTIALRVASAAESQDLLGTADASRLPLHTPGRAILARGTSHTEIQVARPSATPTPPVRVAGEQFEPQPAALAHSAERRWHSLPRPARLWRDPLPQQVDVASIAVERPPGESSGLLLGLADFPAERRQDAAWWLPSRGALVVVGPRASGRSETLRCLAEQAVHLGLRPVLLPDNLREAARTIALVHHREDILLMIDDAGSALSALAQCDLGAPLEMASRRLARGLPTALALAPHDPARFAANAGTLVVLTGTDAADDAMWNVPRALAGRPALPGRGRMRQGGQWSDVQLCVADRSAGTAPVAPQAVVRPLPTSSLAISLCAADSSMLGIGGDGALPIHLPAADVTVVGAPSRERDAVVSHVTSVAHSAPSAVTVSVRDDIVTFPGSARVRGTIVLTQPTPRSVRDASGTETVGVIDEAPVYGRVVVVNEQKVAAVQLPLVQS